MSADLNEIVTYMNAELRIAELPDYPGAVNGLQLDGSGEVCKVAAAVDASLPVVGKAVEAGADLLLVHHGMFWHGAKPVTGALFAKLKLAMDAGMAIYSAHIPLDVHPELGNNRCLVAELELLEVEDFFEWKGILLGCKGLFSGTREDLVSRVAEAVGGDVHLCPGGGEAAGTVGVITGGAGSEIEAMAAAGIDTFVTGEGPHWSFTAAEELGVNVVYGGHYATETFGVRALAARLAARFGVDWSFVDHPTGL